MDRVACCCGPQLPCLTFDHGGSLVKRWQHSWRRVTEQSPPARAACAACCLLLPCQALVIQHSPKGTVRTLGVQVPKDKLPVQTLGVQGSQGQAPSTDPWCSGIMSEEWTERRTANLLVIRQNVSAVFLLYPSLVFNHMIINHMFDYHWFIFEVLSISSPLVTNITAFN